MEIRQATKDTYIKFLTELASPISKNKPSTVLEMSKVFSIDIKLPTWMASKGYLIQSGEKQHFIASYQSDTNFFNQLIDEFVAYRGDLQAKYDADKKDLKYYRTNRAFLVDTRHTTAIPHPEKEAIILETRNKLITEVVEYVELGLKLGKTDIKAFVTTLLNSK